MRATNDAQGTWLTLKPLDHTLRSGDSASDAEAWVNRQKTPFESIWYSLWAIFINFPVELPWETTGFPYLCWFTGTILFCWKAILSSFARFFHLPHWCKTFFLDHFSNGPWPLYDPQKWTFSIDLGKNNWWTDGRNSSFFTGCWQIKHLATRLVNLV